MAVNTSESNTGRAIRFLQEVALDAGKSPWQRFGATKSMADLRNEYKVAIEGANDADRNRYTLKMNQLTEIINIIKNKESNNQLMEIYQQF